MFEQQTRRALKHAAHLDDLETKALAAGVVPGVAIQVAQHADHMARSFDIDPDDALRAMIRSHDARNALRATKTRQPNQLHRHAAKVAQIAREVMLRALLKMRH